MKLLLVNTRHFRGGGDSTYTLNLADLLRARGHEVAFLAMEDDRSLPNPSGDSPHLIQPGRLLCDIGV